MLKTMEALSSGILIPVDTMMDPNLPEEPLTTERQKGLLQKSIEHASEKYAGKHLFVDGSTSSGRIPEYSHDAMTCIRPSHGIYSAKYKRWVTVEEMWKAQGLWVSNFENPQAVRDMLATNPKDAQDLCGNAFSGTAVQAKVLASMVHSMGWVNIANEKNQYKNESIVVSALDALHHAPSSESNDVEPGFQTPTDSKKCSLKRSFSMISTPRSATTSVSKDSGLKPVVDHQKPAEKGEKDPDPEPAPLKRQRYTKKSKTQRMRSNCNNFCK